VNDSSAHATDRTSVYCFVLFLCDNFRRKEFLKLQYNVQRFSLKHLQKVESNKSISAKNDKAQQLQLRQAEKDYYELFEALAERDRAQNTGLSSPFHPYLLSQSQSQYGSESGSFTPPAIFTGAEEDSVKLGGTLASPGASALVPHASQTRTPRFKDEYKSDSDSSETTAKGAGKKTVKLDDFVSRRTPTRAMAALNAPSMKFDDTPQLTPIINRNDSHTTPAAATTTTAASSGAAAAADHGHSAKRSTRSAAGDPSSSARSSRLPRRGLSAKFDEEGNAQSIVLKPMPTAIHAHDTNCRNWAQRSLNHMHVHKAMAQSMARSAEVSTDHDAFCRRFEQECRRTFEHVHTLSGILEVTPMQALRLPETKNPVLVRVSYGETVRASLVCFCHIVKPHAVCCTCLPLFRGIARSVCHQRRTSLGTKTTTQVPPAQQACTTQTTQRVAAARTRRTRQALTTVAHNTASPSTGRRSATTRRMPRWRRALWWIR
jgi:hypothetical protein